MDLFPPRSRPLRLVRLCVRPLRSEGVLNDELAQGLHWVWVRALGKRGVALAKLP
jgi:hypothetical protein